MTSKKSKREPEPEPEKLVAIEVVDLFKNSFDQFVIPSLEEKYTKEAEGFGSMNSDIGSHLQIELERKLVTEFLKKAPEELRDWLEKIAILEWKRFNSEKNKEEQIIWATLNDKIDSD